MAANEVFEVEYKDDGQTENLNSYILMLFLLGVASMDEVNG
jgi:hypothetical protein